METVTMGFDWRRDSILVFIKYFDVRGLEKYVGHTHMQRFYNCTAIKEGKRICTYIHTSHTIVD